MGQHYKNYELELGLVEHNHFLRLTTNASLVAHQRLAMALKKWIKDKRLGKNVRGVELGVHLPNLKNASVRSSVNKVPTKINMFSTLASTDDTLGPTNTGLVIIV